MCVAFHSIKIVSSFTFSLFSIVLLSLDALLLSNSLIVNCLYLIGLYCVFKSTSRTYFARFAAAFCINHVCNSTHEYAPGETSKENDKKESKKIKVLFWIVNNILNDCKCAINKHKHKNIE